MPNRTPRCACHLTAVVLVMATHAPMRSASAQERETNIAPQFATGLWVAGGVTVGATILDGRADRPWQRVGDFGPSLGTGLSLAYDFRRGGAALDIETASTRVADRRGSNLAVAVVTRWPSPWQPLPAWTSRLMAGYVRYGLGGTVMASSELPAGVFRSNLPLGTSGDARLRLLGNGARLGIEAEQVLGFRTRLVIGAGADVVYFDTANYDHYDMSLAEPGWGVLPRLTLGIRTSLWR
jgi:hypothetical protein